ncbi:MAG: RHS repeat-associated core domain-containing protein [Chloroflexi bacterium]|nr:RHS repeat-associated core domain-containing protein [Chloroflexota bacterium]
MTEIRMAGRLKRISAPALALVLAASTSLTGYGNRTFTYDALGRLTGVTGNGVAATYTLDGDGNRWAETLNAATTSFDLDLSVANPTVLFDGARRYLPGNPAIGYEQAGTWWSGLADQIGSPVFFVSQAGAQTTPVHYDPYGAPLAGSTDPTGIGYAGEWKNATGLVNLRARSYDPVSGRFVGRDTFGGAQLLPQTANRYAYANLNPLRYGDPSGHFGRAWNAWGASALELVVSFNPVGYAVITGYQLLTGTDPATGAQVDRTEVLKWAAITVATVGVAAVAKAALPILRGVADDVARLGDDAAVGLRGAAGRVGSRANAGTRAILSEARAVAGGERIATTVRAVAPGRALIRHPFSSGASHITTTARIEAYPLSATLGSPRGFFVSPSAEVDALLARASSRGDIEVALGLGRGALARGQLVRFDIKDPFAYGLRLPPAELGNLYHIAGSGRTIGGVTEAIIDTPLRSDPSVAKHILEWFR